MPDAVLDSIRTLHHRSWPHRFRLRRFGLAGVALACLIGPVAPVAFADDAGLTGTVTDDHGGAVAARRRARPP